MFIDNFDLSHLSREDKQKLSILLDELQSRGIELDLDSLPISSSYTRKDWNLDNRGYFTKLDGTQYNSNEVQKAFIESNAVFCGFWGSRGSGKSSSGSQKALRKIMAGENGIIANPDFTNLQISTWPEFREWIPWNMVVPPHKRMRNPEWQPSKPFVLAFKNGVRVIIKGIKDPDSARGPNVNWMWFDEAQRTDDERAWQIAVASVRVGKDPQSWATFTANGTNHWTTKFFINKDIPEDALAILDNNRPMVEDFHGTLHDNKENLSPVFVAQIMAAYPSGWLRDQEVYGRIVSREGALGNPKWFEDKILPSMPEDASIYASVRYWDLAASERKIGDKRFINDPDETVGTLLHWDKENDRFYCENQVSGTWTWKDIKQVILETAIQDGAKVKIFVEQEPASGGKNQVAELVDFIAKNLPHFPRLEGHNPRGLGDKVMRANTWFSEAANGKIYLISGDWIDGFLAQLGCFPMCKHDDKIDSFSGARHTLAPIKRWRRIPFLKV